MNNTKRIVFATLMALAPFVANATQTVVETNTPAAVGANGTVKEAATTGPYVTNEPTAADQTHIATTAYVKGAYNDAIAAVNKVSSDMKEKQGQLFARPLPDDPDFEAGVPQYVASSLDEINDMRPLLVTGLAVKTAIDDVNNNIAAKRVKIYTTWDDDRDSATTLVPFATAQ